MLSLWRRIKKSNFYIRLTHWEFWPFGIIQFPLFFYYPWLAFRAGSLTFFTGSNPGIVMGGMFGESKFDVLQKIPEQWIPRSFLLRQPATLDDVSRAIEVNNLSFPLIFKPDIGERGFMVKRIFSLADVSDYLEKMKHDFLIQELVDDAIEMGVFYKRLPCDTRGEITSIVLKEMLTVTGDGHSSLKNLILQNSRAKLQWPVLRETYREQLPEVPAVGEKKELVSIGNHCLGTKFINGNPLIDPELTEVFDSLSKKIDGFFFGRYDLRCKSIDHLRRGEFKVLELNGCGAEPAHIYDPEFPLSKAITTLIDHWKTIYIIARQNQLRGYRFLPLKDAISYYYTFKAKIR
jgi:hypothetical protein